MNELKPTIGAKMSKQTLNVILTELNKSEINQNKIEKDLKNSVLYYFNI